MATTIRDQGRWAALLLLAVLASGCGANLVPFETRPRSSLTESVSATRYVGVCYNALFARPDEVRSIAADACGLDGAPRLLGQDTRLSCPLMTPTRATFACTAD
jgi:hypothetical protein